MIRQKTWKTAKAGEGCCVELTQDCGDRGWLTGVGGGRPRWLWNSAEGNREPENGSKIGPDAVAWAGRALPGGRSEGRV